MADWKETVAKIAPGVATALGGPLAGLAVTVVSRALGVENSEDAVAEAVLSGDPQTLLKLRDAERHYHIELTRLGVQDRADARDLAKAKGMMPQMVLSALYTLGYFYMVYMLFTGKVSIPEQHQSLADGMIAIMTGAQLQIMNFWFGSSAGSKRKDS